MGLILLFFYWAFFVKFFVDHTYNTPRCLLLNLRHIEEVLNVVSASTAGVLIEGRGVPAESNRPIKMEPL